MKIEFAAYAAAVLRKAGLPLGQVYVKAIKDVSLTGITLDASTLPETATVVIRQRTDGSFVSVPV